MWHRADAVDATLKFGKLQKQTLSQHLKHFSDEFDLGAHKQIGSLVIRDDRRRLERRRRRDRFWN